MSDTKLPAIQRIFFEDLPRVKFPKVYKRVEEALEHFFLSGEMENDDRFRLEEFSSNYNDFDDTPIQVFRYNDYRGWRPGGTRYEGHMRRQYRRWLTHRSESSHGKLEGGSALWYHRGKKWMASHGLL